MTGSAAVLLLMAVAAPAPAVAQGPPPTLTVGAETRTFGAPVLLLREEPAPHVSMLFPASPLSPDLEASGRAAGTWAAIAKTVAPAVVVDLDYTPGSTSGMVEQLKACRIMSVGFKTEWQTAGTASQCHVLSIGGLLKSGGGIAGLLEGKGQGYALRLPFSGALGQAAPAAAATAAAATASAAPTAALNTVSGTGTYQGQSVKVTHALAWWAADKGQVRVALFDHAPRPGTLAQARAGSFDDDPSLIDLYVGVGASHDLSTADYCYVNVTFPKGGPLGTNTSPKGCGLTAFTTDARPGGTVFAVVKGSGPGPAGPYSWDITVHVPLAK
jgi:hypothetical protein